MIGVDRPKDIHNFGGILRAAHVYGAAGIVLAGDRYTKASANTTKAERHIPLFRVADVFDCLPYDCVPVAVDLLEGATPLPQYVHPERAFYIFGAEDNTLGARITDRCRDKVYVPTAYCMNLAATVNVILYDRMAKQFDKDIVIPIKAKEPKPESSFEKLAREHRESIDKDWPSWLKASNPEFDKSMKKVNEANAQ